ncbi:type VI secretion system lipoprotein TssJ [Photobacterium sanctipauli]|uniref:Type VI secretion system lipoprotein TssJ n=1 Tax=Photobacterium sanctipauli TaxID=1342794 RepID=A0A2T3NYQ6_9GAMM|nr:type VI secretion system lipoprotein TssJ [Photobacterium sanctipauli]PSW21405.1 type VI secretion system lipoprotein TssJ [Photobacterium sanctipauli]
MKRRPFINRGALIYSAIGVISSLLLGCSSNDNTAFVPAMDISVNLAASEDINTFDDGQSRPVIIRLYQLVDTGNFQKSDFITLYESDKSVLADSLVDSTTVAPVIPGEQRTFQLEIQQQAKFIAVLAEFADYESAAPKAYTAIVEEPEDYPLIIRITSNKVEISQPVEDAWWNVF